MTASLKRRIQREFDSIDHEIANWMHEYGFVFLRMSVAIVFIWFGSMKFFGLSPANDLVTNTVYWADPSWFIPLLGGWEVVIGLCFLYKPLVRLGILLLAPQMVGTFMPLVLLPEVVFQNPPNPYFLTIEGQYIIKNLLIIGAAIVIGSTVREKNIQIIKN